MKSCRSRKKIRFFTLVELLVSMAVFAILALFLMKVFSSTQNVWDSMSRKTSVRDTARVILDTMENDLRSWQRPPRKSDGTDPDRKFFYVSALPSSSADSADNLAATPFSLALLSSCSSDQGTSDLHQTMVRYSTLPITVGESSKRLGCLFRKCYFSNTDAATYTAFLSAGTVPSAGSGDLLASNIYSLKVEARTSSGTLVNGECYPDYLLITLRLMDEDMVESYLELSLDNDPGDSTKQAKIQLENIHTFKRIVVLN